MQKKIVGGKIKDNWIIFPCAIKIIAAWIKLKYLFYSECLWGIKFEGNTYYHNNIMYAIFCVWRQFVLFGSDWKGGNLFFDSTSVLNYGFELGFRLKWIFGDQMSVKIKFVSTFSHQFWLDCLRLAGNYVLIQFSVPIIK